jgi:hypothetical protein
MTPVENRSYHPVAVLRAAWKRSPWIVISVGAHVTLGAVLALIVVGREKAPQEEPKFASIVRPPSPAVAIEPPPLEEVLIRQSTPTDKELELVTTEVPADIVIDPTAQRDWLEEAGLADGDDLSDLLPEMSSNAGVGNGPGFVARAPTSIGKHRPGRIGPGGPRGDPAVAPTERTERAVLEGLRWLARHQTPDGHWGAPALREMCLPGMGCVAVDQETSPYYDVGLTSLALLAYLGAGHGHNSRVFTADTVVPQKRVMGEIVRRGLEWLVDAQREDGSFGAGRTHMYNQALATMALCEAYGLTQNRNWRAPAQRAVDFLVAAQKPNPNGSGTWGWRYLSRQDIEDRKARGELDEGEYVREIHDADTSVTTWCVMALKSAQLSGLRVPQASLDGALAYVRWVTPREASSAPRGNVTGGLDTSRYPGTVGYIDPSSAGQKVGGPGDHYTYHTAAMSALGMCARTFSAHDLADPFLEAAAKWIVKDLPSVTKDRLSVDYYYWYYGSLALNQYDGPDSPRQGQRYWKPWNEAMTRALLELQDETEQNCSKGGWLVADRWCHTGGPIYATALNVLTLEVYYRYENAFGAAREKQRKKDAGRAQRTQGEIEAK